MCSRRSNPDLPHRFRHIHYAVQFPGWRGGKATCSYCQKWRLSPDGWARAVAAAAARWEADRVVAEANNGGAMVAQVLRAAAGALEPKLVRASRGKVARAEPVAVLFEAGRAFFAGAFPALEDELAGLQAGGENDGPTRSPDRADACVWALSELALVRASMPRVRMLW